MFSLFGNGDSLFEILGEFVSKFLQESDLLPVVEVATFSGKEEDVESVDGAIYLRLKWQKNADADGQPGEIVARLVGPSGLWHIPTEETQMLVLAPPNVFGSPGTAWCLWGALGQSVKVSITKAVMHFADTVTFISKARAHIFKSADDFVFGTIPTDDEEKKGFVAGWQNGTRIAIMKTAIELQITDDSATPVVKSRLRLDRDGIKMFTGNVSLELVGSSGKFVTIGQEFYAGHAGGRLGIAGTLPIGNPVTASLNWMVSP